MLISAKRLVLMSTKAPQALVSILSTKYSVRTMLLPNIMYVSVSDLAPENERIGNNGLKIM